jgi:gamma-glutamylcyclotransferase (GGCT)/AIG2-like uncharacterized protein YtfP
MLLFVYGTLKKNQRNNHILTTNNGVLIDECISIKKYPMYNSKYQFPFLINKPEFGFQIKGELWDVPENKIKNIDKFEDVPHLYYKENIDVLTDKLNVVQAVAYFKTEEKTEKFSNMKLIENFS